MIKRVSGGFILFAAIIMNLCFVFPVSSAQDDQNEISAMRKKGIEYASEARFKEAEVEFRNILSVEKTEQFSVSALKVFNDLNKGVIKGEYVVLLFKAFDNLQKGLPQDAVLSLQKAIGVNPKYAKAYNVLGMVYVTMGKEDDALASFRSAIEVDPVYGEACYNLAALYQAQGKYQQAVDCYQKAISCGMDSLDVNINLGASYVSLSKYKEAIVAYEKAIRVDSRNAKLYYDLGLAYLMADQYFKAKDNLLKAKGLYSQQGNQEGVQAVEKYLSRFTDLENKWHSKQ